MMPINHSERRKAFLNFLLFFAITIAIILTTVFFSFRVPLEDNEKLRKQMDIVENEKVFLRSFGTKMQQTVNLIDSTTRQVDDIRINQEIKNNLASMTAMINDSISVKSICNEIINNLSSLHEAKVQLRSVNNNTLEIEKKDRTIDDLRVKLNEKENQITVLLARQVN